MTFPLSHVQQLPGGRFQLADLQAGNLHELQRLWEEPVRFGSLELERVDYLTPLRLQGFDWTVGWIEHATTRVFHKFQQSSLNGVVAWRLFGANTWHTTPVEAVVDCLTRELTGQLEALVEALHGTSMARKHLTLFLGQNPQVTLPTDQSGV